MTLVTIDPLRNFARMQGEVARLMRDALDGMDESSEVGGRYAPPVDIIEHGDEVVLLADLPGIDTESIDVSVENRTLTLTGERKPVGPPESGQVFRTERSHGRFHRTFALPMTVDPARISAEYHDGVLRVVLPKAEAARPRRIEVKTV